MDLSFQPAADRRAILAHPDRYSRRDILEILLQIPFSFLFAAFIDFNMMFTGQLHPGSYGLSVALLLTGCVVQSIGVVLEIKPGWL